MPQRRLPRRPLLPRALRRGCHPPCPPRRVPRARGALPPDLAAYIGRVKARAGNTPVAVGFGISTAEHVRQVGSIADGAIVGAALIRAAGDAADPAQAAFEFVRELKK